jgi:hypothetical protein
MPVLKKINLEKDFTIYPNKLCQNEKMSYEAKGLLVELLSRPDNWQINKAQLERETAKRDKITRIIKELTDLKHLYLHTELDPISKQFVDRYYIASIVPLEKEEFKKYIINLKANDPRYGEADAGNSPDTGFPSEGKPLEGETPQREKPPLQNKDLLQSKDSLQRTYIPEAEKTASVNADVGAKEKKQKEPAYRCNGYSWNNVHKDCEGHSVHVEFFKKTHLQDTKVPYADVKADYVNAARMHKIYGCQKLIEFQRRFWQLYRSEYDDVLAKKRLSFGVFISSIPTIIADLNQSDRDFVRREQRFEKKRAVA